ncbi:MAG: Phosphatidylserine decarboxylase proenzyme 2 [Chlamydiales bacterium]|nr:Phosphatidylserine decarboxylase proenzyme 2 [Chlamydiales bacterium]MCH9636268.1 Phosphatidylserine decarboxylase proenzyme 2 [Chlamydiales bacterium]
MIIDNKTGKEVDEQVYCETALKLLYAKNPLSRLLKNVICRLPAISKLYGSCQNLPWTKAKIVPFIRKFDIDASEFEKHPNQFTSFNDFFVRRLRKEARPICSKICMPADGRYLAYQNIAECDGFFVKGQKFSLPSLLQDTKLAKQYQNGSAVFGRLAPVDYHRFHFPCAGTPAQAKLINGPLFSVNPLALKQNIHKLTENKRMITQIQTEVGKLLMIEVGATNVGSIHQTFDVGKGAREGYEKGFFSFGGSALILLFEPDSVELDPNIIANSKAHLETRCLMGQFLARPL